jgi:hypothetical protein
VTFARKRIKSCLAAGTRPSLLQLRRWHWFAIEPVYEMWLPVFGFALTGIGLGSRRDRKAKWLCTLFFAGLLFQVACGGGEQTARQSRHAHRPVHHYRHGHLRIAAALHDGSPYGAVTSVSTRFGLDEMTAYHQ